MRHIISILVCSWFAMPGVAFAEAVELLAHQVSSRGLSLTLSAPGPETAEARVRASRHSLRIWVPVEGSIARFELHRSEGQPYDVDVRPGADSSLLVRVVGPTRPSRDLVEVTRDGERVQIFVRNPRYGAAIAARAAAQTLERVEAEPAQPVAEEKPSASEPEPEPKLADAEPEPQAEPAEANVIAASEDDDTSLLKLIWLTVVLGAGALAVKLWPRKMKLDVEPDIAIVGRKNLGPRHQLMVVRALGEDHLISVQPSGRVERLSSCKSFVGPLPMAPEDAPETTQTFQRPAPEAANQGSPKLGSPEGKKRLRLLFDRSEQHEDGFSGQSFQGALASLSNRPDSGEMPAVRSSESPAVRGLQELRRRQVS